MISNGFYNYHNLKQEYLGGKVKHYPIKDASITLEWYEYIVKANETLYTIAARVFVKYPFRTGRSSPITIRRAIPTTGTSET